MAYSQTEEETGKSGRLAKGLHAMLLKLLKARECAADDGRDVWDFSVEIHELQSLGFAASDFRWLICKQIVEHCREITLPGDPRRVFRPEGELTFSKRTCFVLTAEGVNFARRVLADAVSEDHDEPTDLPHISPKHPRSGNGCADSRPHWDAARRELRLDGQIVKRFRVPSPNQELILNAFEEEGWPARIDDPLPPKHELNSKRRLSDTIKSLNQCHCLSLLRFRGDGRGRGVCWEPLSLTPPSPDESPT